MSESSMLPVSGAMVFTGGQVQLEEPDPLGVIAPDLALRFHDIRPGKPPCLEGDDLAQFLGALTDAVVSEFPDAYVDSTCIGVNPDERATAFGVWRIPPTDAAHREQMRRGLTELGHSTVGQPLSFFINARLFAWLAAKFWADPDTPKRFDG